MFAVEVMHGVIRYGFNSGVALVNLDQVKGFIAALDDPKIRRVIVYCEAPLGGESFGSLFDYRPESNRFPIDAMLIGD